LPKNTLTALAILLPLLVLMTFSSEGAAQDPYRNNVTDKIEPACYDQQLLIQHSRFGSVYVISAKTSIQRILF
jgi:hypothetical protein